MSKQPWIGVDLDGTLAYYNAWTSLEHIGEPIRPMLERVSAWLAEGHEVRIMTARVSQPQTREVATKVIQEWLLKHLGMVLPVTNEKDFAMVALYDDRAIQVETNTGRLIHEADDYNY